MPLFNIRIREELSVSVNNPFTAAEAMSVSVSYHPTEKSCYRIPPRELHYLLPNTFLFSSMNKNKLKL
jgi:hypothetical protein